MQSLPIWQTSQWMLAFCNVDYLCVCVLQCSAVYIDMQAERRFDCYIRYCTNQIYQTRELQECL